MNKRAESIYLMAGAVVWASIMIGSAVVLKGTPYFAQLLPFLLFGVVWFVVLVPAGIFKNRQ